jgi:predicted ATP-binding protein involved in virulence
MRIDEITLKNFKKFEQQQFRFAPSFNLLVGRNGSGKTTILDGISVAMGSWLLGMASFNKDCKARSIEREEARLKCIQYNKEGSRFVRYEYQHPVVVQARGEVAGEVLEWRRTLESQSGRTTTTGASNLKWRATKAGRMAMRGEEDVTLPLISYYGTGRIWQQPRDLKARRESSNTKASKSRLKGYLNSHDPRSDANALFRWIQTQEYASLQDGVAPELNAVRKAILGCIEGGKRLYFSVKLADLILEIEGQERQPFNNLSDGYRNMIAMVGDIAWKAVQLNPHLGTKAAAETPGIVLIDELDLHLHPTWQRRVIEDLRRTFPKIQFICTTHSPFLVQTARADELISLDGQTIPNTAKLGIENIAEDIMGVGNLEVSPRYLEMKEAAKEYLLTLDEAATSPRDKLAAYEKRLAEGLGPFADNPAFQAFLELKRAAKLGVREGANGH